MSGIYFHEACYEKSIRCGKCEVPILHSAIKDGPNGWLHKACFSKSPNCKLCTHAILRGRYMKDAEGNNYHNHCYQNSSKCDLCKGPVSGTQVTSSSGTFHGNCYKEAEKCDMCADPLRGVYYEDLYDRPTCAAHREGPKCGVCASPNVAWTLKDGRHQCDRCQSSAIYDGPIVEDKVAQLSSFMQSQGMVVKSKVYLELVGKDEFSSSEGESHPLLVGLFTIKPLPARRSDKRTIQVLYGLPAIYFESVFIHELTHAWQAENCPPNQDKVLKEGTAELMAYLYLKEIGADLWLGSIEDKKVEPYRTGFQRALAMYQRLGHEGFLRVIKSSTHFPSGY